jgi:hypothetical protein
MENCTPYRFRILTRGDRGELMPAPTPSPAPLPRRKPLPISPGSSVPLGICRTSPRPECLRPVVPMIRTTRTLHGTRYAVLALLVATAALAFDLGRSACPKAAPVQTTLTRSI